jgi:hypothetical protein
VQTSTFFDLLKDERAAMIRKDILIASFFMALAAGTLYLYIRKTLSVRVAVIIICILPVLDLLIVDRKPVFTNNNSENRCRLLRTQTHTIAC